jgi:RNA polymerase sigma-54 factor
VLPDAIIRQDPERPGELVVEVPDGPGASFIVDPLYRRLAAEPDAGPPAARDHARRFVRQADAFVALLDRRSRTIARVVAHLAERQARFVREGAGTMRPLTRAEVARELGLHESTVSRAVAGKFVLLPGGRLSPLSAFFPASPGLEDALRAVLAAEERPLTDRELGERLRGMGYPVARRTVVKYRGRLGVNVHSLR